MDMGDFQRAIIVARSVFDDCGCDKAPSYLAEQMMLANYGKLADRRGN